MPKLLRAVRLDDSDQNVFRSCGAAADGEPVVTGGYAVCQFDTSPRCDPPCHCAVSFIAIGSRARCSIAEVVETQEERGGGRHLAWPRQGLGRPSWEAARGVAEGEIRHTAKSARLAPEVGHGEKREARRRNCAGRAYSVYDR